MAADGYGRCRCVNLINETTITLDAARECDELEFFNIKLASHDVIYVQGTEVEMLLTVDERAVNFADYFRRYGASRGDETRCAPVMSGRFRERPQRWRSLAVVGLPGIVLSPLWMVGVSAEVAAWRVREGHDYPPEQFDPLWKLAYMWEHPLHFPMAAWTAVRDWGAPLWPELIGILGWQDIRLRPWTYLVPTILLLAMPLQRLPADGTTRARVAVLTGLVVLGYVVLVYLIFFLTYTPVDS